MPITAATLHSLVACPHRVTMDLFADPAERDPVSPFVRLLWERGTVHEDDTIGDLRLPFLDLSGFTGEEKERRTTDAMASGEPLIYGGRIRADDLLGEPDLLRRCGSGYIAGDIKSGMGQEGPEDLRRPKLHYAVQLGLYVDILERKGLSGGRTPFIWDINGEEFLYDLDAPRGERNPQSLWMEYQDRLKQAQGIVAKTVTTLPAYGAVCKLCHWHSACLKRLEAADDLTLLPGLGRCKRDAMMDRIGTISVLSEINVEGFVQGQKTVFPRVGSRSLHRFQERAKLVKSVDSRPYLREPIMLPVADLEILFDVEVDPLRDICYLHGFVERWHGDDATRRYTGIFTDDPDLDEEAAFASAWRFLAERRSAAIYYYSPYEETIWRRLQERYRPHRKVIWAGIDIFSAQGLAQFEADAQEAIDYLGQRAFGFSLDWQEPA
jgi:predicted RecB family nuclease